MIGGSRFIWRLWKISLLSVIYVRLFTSYAELLSPVISCCDFLRQILKSKALSFEGQLNTNANNTLMPPSPYYIQLAILIFPFIQFHSTNSIQLVSIVYLLLHLPTSERVQIYLVQQNCNGPQMLESLYCDQFVNNMIKSLQK